MTTDVCACLCVQALMPMLVYTAGVLLGTEQWSRRTGSILAIVVGGVLLASYGALVGLRGDHIWQLTVQEVHNTSNAAESRDASCVCPTSLPCNPAATCTGEVVFVLLGVLFQGASLLSEAVRLTLVQLLLQQRGFKLNPISTMYHISPVCFMALLIPLATLEAEKVCDRAHTKCDKVTGLKILASLYVHRSWPWLCHVLCGSPTAWSTWSSLCL